MIILNERDKSLINNTVSEFLRSGYYQLLRVDCFNKEEADAYRTYIEHHYPDVKAEYHWLEFGRREGRRDFGY